MSNMYADQTWRPDPPRSEQQQPLLENGRQSLLISTRDYHCRPFRRGLLVGLWLSTTGLGIFLAAVGLHAYTQNETLQDAFDHFNLLFHRKNDHHLHHRTEVVLSASGLMMLLLLMSCGIFACYRWRNRNRDTTPIPALAESDYDTDYNEAFDEEHGSSLRIN